MITLIGIISLILSIIALFKNDKWLLKLVIFFSVFTAAVASSSPITILPFEIPMIFWVLIQIINWIRSSEKKETLTIIIGYFKTNKIYRAIVFLAIALTLSEIWLLISNFEYSYVDFITNASNIIKFSFYNFNQYVRHMFYLFFALMLSIKIRDKKEIGEYLHTFYFACMFAIFWGFLQLALYSFNIAYPVSLFNNNPFAYQGYDQFIRNFKRINSIALEPSTFSLNIVAFLPFVLVPWVFDSNKKSMYKKYLLVSILTIVCGLLTFSSTLFVTYVVQFVVFGLIVLFKKSNTKIKEFKRLFLVAVAGIGITVLLSFSSLYVRNSIASKNQVDNEKNVPSVNNNVVDESPESNNLIESVLDITINKLSSGSGKERIEREKYGLSIYKLSPVFGVGISSYRTFTLFTNILVNVGIIGLVSVVYIFFTTFKNIIVNYKKDKLMALVFLISLLGMLIAFAFSVPDLIYIYCWVIVVFSYNYFNGDEKGKIKNDVLRIGIDARGLGKNRTGISTYIEKNLEQFNRYESKNKKIKFILYSSKEIKLSFEPNSIFEIKVYNKYKYGTIFLRYALPKILYRDNIDIFWGTQHVLPRRNYYTKDIRYVLTVHDLAIHRFGNIGDRKNTIIQKLYLKKSCNEADNIVADSISTKQDIVSILKVDKDKINVVYLGTNFNNDCKLSEKEEKSILNKFNVSDKNYLLFVSTIEPRKNIVTLVKSFELLKSKNKKLKLILAGGLGWKYEEIIKAIDNSPYKGDINLAGYISREEKEYLMHNCKCLVYPSLYEGFGLPVLEAMNKGAIVVTSNNSSIPEVGGDAALYYDNVYDEVELANTIQKVLDMNNKERSKYVKKGLLQSKKFTWEKCYKETLNNIIGK